MLGNTLKLIRIANDKSISSVSKHTNLKVSLIQNIENGKAKISLSTLNIFSDFYKIPLSKILLLNDFQEHFEQSDEKIIDDIKIYYEYMQSEENKELIKFK